MNEPIMDIFVEPMIDENVGDIVGDSNNDQNEIGSRVEGGESADVV